MKIVGLASTICIAGTGISFAQEAEFKFSETPLYKMEAPLSPNIAGSNGLNLEILRNPSGGIAQLDLLTGGEAIAARRCPCITVSVNPFVCVTVPCGGGTFSAPDLFVFQEMEPSIDLPHTMRVFNMETNEQTTFTLPPLTIGDDGNVEMAQ